jgi:hypothetical protein
MYVMPLREAHYTVFTDDANAHHHPPGEGTFALHIRTTMSLDVDVFFRAVACGKITHPLLLRCYLAVHHAESSHIQSFFDPLLFYHRRKIGCSSDVIIQNATPYAHTLPSFALSNEETVVKDCPHITAALHVIYNVFAISQYNAHLLATQQPSTRNKSAKLLRWIAAHPAWTVYESHTYDEKWEPKTTQIVHTAPRQRRKVTGSPPPDTTVPPRYAFPKILVIFDTRSLTATERNLPALQQHIFTVLRLLPKQFIANVCRRRIEYVPLLVYYLWQRRGEDRQLQRVFNPIVSDFNYSQWCPAELGYVSRHDYPTVAVRAYGLPDSDDEFVTALHDMLGRAYVSMPLSDFTLVSPDDYLELAALESDDRKWWWTVYENGDRVCRWRRRQ